jgi:hypothetical protein
VISIPDPLLELSVGGLGLVVAILLHGAGLRVVTRLFNRIWRRITPHTPHWRTDLALGVVVAGLVALHLAGSLLWAAPIYASGAIDTSRDSIYFVLQSYTTLGDGRIELPEAWRLIGPFIAMTGLFTFGWTTSVLVTIMTQINRFEGARARADDSGPGAER